MALPIARVGPAHVDTEAPGAVDEVSAGFSGRGAPGLVIRGVGPMPSECCEAKLH